MQKRGMGRQEAVNWLTKLLVKMRKQEIYLEKEFKKEQLTIQNATTADVQQHSNSNIDNIMKESEHAADNFDDWEEGSEDENDDDSDDDCDDGEDIFLFDDSAESQLHNLHMLQSISIDLRDDLKSRRPPLMYQEYKEAKNPYSIDDALRNLHLNDEAGPSHKRVKKEGEGS